MTQHMDRHTAVGTLAEMIGSEGCRMRHRVSLLLPRVKSLFRQSSTPLCLDLVRQIVNGNPEQIFRHNILPEYLDQLTASARR
jgi:hypothetical protein